MRETWVWSLGRKIPLEKEMAPHSSILAWRIPWMEEPGRLQSTGSQRVWHDWATSLSLSDGKESACNAGDLGLIPEWGKALEERNGYPLQYSCLENPMDREAWRAIVHGAAKSRTQLTNTFNFSGDNRNIIGGCVNLILLWSLHCLVSFLNWSPAELTSN